MLLIGAFVLLVFAYSLVSRRLEGSVITAPMLFAAAGMAVAQAGAALPELVLERGAFLAVAELGLVLTLFTDASHIRLASLKAESNWSLRLLGIGMLLTMALGAAIARWVFPGLSWLEAGILAAILAPTDAGLGQPIINSRQLPLRVRRTLSVEAGLNDGLAVPFLLLFIALAQAEQGSASAGALLGSHLVEQIGFGTLIGLAVGAAGGGLLGLAQRRDWMAPALAQLAVVALPLLCVLLSQASGASMFIAAFVAGLAVQWGFAPVGRHSVEFTEDWGQLFGFSVFFLFGAVVAAEWQQFTAPMWWYAAASLSLVRMLPVALALWGSGLSRASVLFVGWFGPRGLASIVLGLVYLEREAHLAGEPTLRLTVMVTVLLSIVAHGLSARPGITLYARRTGSLGAQPSEAHGHAASPSASKDAGRR